MNMRNESGTVLGLMPGIVLIIALIGLTYFSLNEYFSCSRHFIYSTDYGPLVERLANPSS